MSTPSSVVSEVTRLTVRNYRVLRDITLPGLTPLTVLLGPNGSGKSTLLDALAFLSDAVEEGVDAAARRRGGLEDIRTLGSRGPIAIEIAGVLRATGGRFRYRLELSGEATPAREVLDWTPPGGSEPRVLLDFESGNGVVHDREKGSTSESIEGDSLALDTFGRLKRFEQVAWVRRFVLDWSSVNIDVARVRAGSRAGVDLSKQ
ncbi:MAG: hypothetical protein QOI78_8824, partial [Actinomycetota bacterium]|nr:hypothetical protein [Actinomycetota bacterium]